MNFFIPHVDDPAAAEKVLQSIRQHAGVTLGWSQTDRRILSIAYVHKGKEYVAKVGGIEPRTGEEVIAILESNAFLVCTPNRGVLRDMPLLVGLEEAYWVVEFEK
jgi:hypothetical protein